MCASLRFHVCAGQSPIWLSPHGILSHVWSPSTPSRAHLCTTQASQTWQSVASKTMSAKTLQLPLYSLLGHSTGRIQLCVMGVLTEPWREAHVVRNGSPRLTTSLDSTAVWVVLQRQPAFGPPQPRSWDSLRQNCSDKPLPASWPTESVGDNKCSLS